MALNDYGSFRWATPACEFHYKLLSRDIVAHESPAGLAPYLWSGLGRSAQALLPVILRHTDEKGVAFPSEGRLAAMAGLTRKTVRSAAKELEGYQLLSIFKRVSRAGRRLNSYHITKLCSDGIQLPSIFIDSGLWSELTPAAKSLSIAFRLFGQPRPDLDPEFGEWLKGEDWEAYLNGRDADYCNAEPSVLRNFAGIGPRVWGSAIQSLQKHYFIEPDEHSATFWRVFIQPPKLLSVSYLNAKLAGEV